MASNPTSILDHTTPPSGPEALGAIRVLQLEDNPVDVELVRRRLEADGLRATYHVVADEHGFRLALATFAPHVVLSDFSLQGFDGLSALEIARTAAAATPFIFVSGTIGEERAIEALKRGATDYVLKDNLRRLVPAITNALRQAHVAAAKELAEEMLRSSQSRLQDIINTSRDWIWECDRGGRFTFSSPSVVEVLGYSQNEILGHPATDYIDRADELQLQTQFEGAAADERFDKAITLRWRHKNGKVRWLERRMVALRDAAGDWRGIRGMDRDVTLRVAQEARIRRLNRALRFLSGASSAGMRIRDRDQLVKEACRLAVSVGGYVCATLYLLPSDGGPAKPLVCSYRGDQGDGARWSYGDSLPSGISAVTQALATAEPVIINDLAAESGLALIVTDGPAEGRSGSQIALPLLSDRSVIGILELDASESGVFGDAELSLLKQVAANITFSLQYLRSKQDVEYLEYFDALTGLANRVLYLTRLDSALESATRHDQHLALAVIDVSELGIVNDSLGHHAGDLVLQSLAERLRAVTRESDAVSRLGGDRFAIMGRPGEANALDALRTRISSCFDAPFSVQGHTLHVSTRAGLVLHPDDGRKAEPLLQAAHTALQHAKQTGVRASRYVPSMNETASQRFNMTNDLRRAVADKSFVLNYQPKLDLDSGSVSGVEALIRWPGAKQSLAPSVFVPILESLGLIEEVGDWVIVAAMTETAAWLIEQDFRVAVNVSPLQLNREDFAEHVLASLCEVGADPQRLEIEVTESSLMADPGRASRCLARLRDAGISIAIDDFGTGHSSLRMLAGLPIDVLKIDRSFVHDLGSNRSHRLIVQTTIGLAQSLGLKTVAEGVETVEQLEMLQDLGCSAAQGYLLSRPVPAHSLTSWLGSEPLIALQRIVTHPREDRTPTARTGVMHVGRGIRGA